MSLDSRLKKSSFKNRSVAVSLRLAPDVLESVKKVALKYDVSQTDVLRILIENGLAELDLNNE
jgi:hypothetical protein